jgi:hypothetical protein
MKSKACAWGLFLLFATQGAFAQSRGLIPWTSSQDPAKPAMPSPEAEAPSALRTEPQEVQRAVLVAEEQNPASETRRIECDAEVARTYPANIWAPGMSRKRQELHDACMRREEAASGQGQQARPAANPESRRIECEAEAARSYPANIWFPGASKKRKELVRVCMVR